MVGTKRAREEGPAATQGVIVRLEVENFKSYKGHQVIGPFKRFTSIIGPNGSGKSNLMDAISFVLGVRSQQLRGAVMRDLVYSYDEADRETAGRRRCFVKLVFQPDAEGADEVHFTRSITPQGASEYRLDDHVVTLDAYDAKLVSFGVLVKARNFLVFQGDVENIAQKSSRELTLLLEQVSESEFLKERYDELEEKKARTEEATQALFSKRKGVASEKTQKREQKEEAEQHIQLEEELRELKMRRVLFQLYHMEQDLAAVEDELQEDRARLSELTRLTNVADQNVAEKKKVQSKSMKDAMVLERKMERKKAAIDQTTPAMVKAKEELGRITKRIKGQETTIGKQRKDHELRLRDIEKLEEDIENVNAAAQQFEADVKQQMRKKSKVQLNEEQMAEYTRCKQEAGAKTFKLKQEREVLVQEHQADLDSKARLDDKVKELEARMQQLDAQNASAGNRKETLEQSIAAAKEELKELQQASTALVDKHRLNKSKREAYASRLEEAAGRLREARADQKESERDSRTIETVEALKRLFPSVRGRMTELLKVTQRKFNLAVTVALGRNTDAVVTEDEKTAKDCIRYLKENRLPSLTFIPLQTIKAKPFNERLRQGQLGGSARLVADVIQYDPSLEQAILYALGNTLVCDTHKEAKALSFSGNERQKVVSLDGTLISKSGLITGGVSGGMEAKAARFDRAGVESLKRDRARMEMEMQQLGNARDEQAAEEKLQQQISALKQKLKYLQVDLKVTDEKLEKASHEHANLAEERKRVLPELKTANGQLKSRDEQINGVTRKVAEIEDSIFEEFSRSVGVPNILAYEEEIMRAGQEASSQRNAYKEQIAKLHSQLDYERKRDTQLPIDKTSATIDKLRAEEKKLVAEAELLKRDTDKESAELNALQAQAQEAVSRAEEIGLEVKELQAQAQAQHSESAKVKKAIAAKETLREQLRAQRGDILTECTMEQIELPRLGDDEQDAVPMSIDGAEGEGGAGPSGEAPLDYSDLNATQTRMRRKADRDRADQNMKDEIASKAAALEKLAPNMKAVQQYEQLKQKEKDFADQLEKAKQEAKQANDEFNAVRQERHNRFMGAFDTISTHLDPIYKALTKSETHPLGGSAYLSLDNVDAPYLGGIKFTAMPATKRFRDLEQLSGGEKTVAALALLFAIHSFRPSPFFVLDEVDAALDGVNVGKVASYIQRKSRESDQGTGDAFQSVVISLKDAFYAHADALVGVFRDPEEGCSKTLTFNLEPYSAAP